MEWVIVGLLVLILGALFYLKKTKPEQKPTGPDPFLLIQNQIDNVRSDLVQVLNQSRQGLDERLSNAGKYILGLESRMVKVEEVSRQVLEVGKDISGLQQILKAPKLRGNFSEELLGDLLAQMMPKENYFLQYTFSSGVRVDAIIKTAQGMVSIDAKFPLENFQRYCQLEDEEEKKAMKKIFMNDVKKHIDDIAEKYIIPQEGTFDFALMYIPAENVYYEIITKDLSADDSRSVQHHALKKKVIPVSPNTFYAYLQTILLGLRGLQVEKRVQEIVTEIAGFRKGFLDFRKDFSLVGKHLSDASSSYDRSDKRLTRIEDKFSVIELDSKEKVLLDSAPLEQ